MSRYEVDKVLWEVSRDPVAQASFETNAASFLAERDLEPQERQALLARDVRTLFIGGAHPFLVYSFALWAAGGWNMAFMEEYVKKLEGLELVDIET